MAAIGQKRTLGRSKMRDKLSQLETEWLAELLAESKRDLVFLFNIEAGHFGGPKNLPEHDRLVQVERMIRALLNSGCVVGYGDPKMSTWSAAPGLDVAHVDLPKTIMKLWRLEPDQYKLLTFTCT
jgi:hypothetical protein